LVIGLTGGIGSGKSEVLGLFNKMKIPAIQTDLIGHELLESREIIRSLAESFGKSILAPDGKIDRRELAHRAFLNKSSQMKLNHLLHPAIQTRVETWVKDQSLKKDPPFILIVEVPLIFEAGYYRKFDGVISVSARCSLRLKRIFKRGWNGRELTKREHYQWTQDRKNKMADWVIHNNGSIKDLKKALFQWIMGFKRTDDPRQASKRKYFGKK
jgi:dephospho-CoA kinase